jgi:hypothetical protein
MASNTANAVSAKRAAFSTGNPPSGLSPLARGGTE